ncbi:hypothetical protein D3C73_1113730 [compost metagenome]
MIFLTSLFPIFTEVTAASASFGVVTEPSASCRVFTAASPILIFLTSLLPIFTEVTAASASLGVLMAPSANFIVVTEASASLTVVTAPALISITTSLSKAEAPLALTAKSVEVKPLAPASWATSNVTGFQAVPSKSKTWLLAGALALNVLP